MGLDLKYAQSLQCKHTTETIIEGKWYRGVYSDEYGNDVYSKLQATHFTVESNGKLIKLELDKFYL